MPLQLKLRRKKYRRDYALLPLFSATLCHLKREDEEEEEEEEDDDDDEEGEGGLMSP
jgi:hypothetical protein